MREMPTIVTSSPSRRTAALPNGTRWSSSSASGTSPRWPYRYSCSMKITGLSSRIALFNSPFASAGVEGTATSSPGTCTYSASNECECVGPSWWPAPCGMRTTSGTATCPPNM